jgi:tRNA uracil 4-sulfurtransferase
MAKYKGIVIHFGELWLKGKNRNTFIRRLHGNIQAALEGEKYEKLDYMRDRFFLVLSKDSDIESIKAKLSKVFGIARFSPVVLARNDLDDIIAVANKLLAKKDKVRVVPHRSVKNLSFDSSEIVKYFIKNEKKLKFKIDKDAETDLYINTTKDFALMYTEKIQGAGGLPVGSSGNAIVLLSGGIDSPVATFYGMKRGLKPIYMHVHAFPDNKDVKISKIKELVNILSLYCANPKIYLMPGHVFQSAALGIQNKYELVLFKLFLYRLAEKIAEKEEAGAIISGEALGQVASQTLGNLTASQIGIKRFIMRPLIGLDKQEIINMAKKIGTFDVSIKDYKDVCSIAAKNPATNSATAKIKRIWKQGNMDSAVKLTLNKLSVIE